MVTNAVTDTLLINFKQMFEAEYKKTVELGSALMAKPEAVVGLKCGHHYPSSKLEDGTLIVDKNPVSFELKQVKLTYTVKVSDAMFAMNDKSTFSKIIDPIVIDAINKTYFALEAKARQNELMFGTKFLESDFSTDEDMLTIQFTTEAIPESKVNPVTHNK